MNREVYITKIREFNRFYLARFQLLNEDFNYYGFSITELMILNKLSEKHHIDFSDLVCQLHLSKGYLSRTLSSLEESGLIKREQSVRDKRCILVSLTKQGVSQWAELNSDHNRRLEIFIAKLSDEKLEKLLAAMKQIHDLTRTSLSIQLSVESAD